MVLPRFCWNAKHALTVSNTVYLRIMLPGKQARCTQQYAPDLEMHLIIMTLLLFVIQREKPCICCLSVLEMYDSVKERMISVACTVIGYNFLFFFYLYFSYKVKSFLKLLLNRKEMFF